MQSTEISSREKLDQMLQNGKITEEEYRRLSQVMTTPSEQIKTDNTLTCKRGKFCKSRKDGLIGGLCAGYAKHFNVDPTLVRSVLILSYALLSVLSSGIGLALIPILYFALCAFVPWDADEKTQSLITSGHPRFFVVTIACLFIVLPMLYSILISPQLESIYSDFEVSVWSVEFQQTLAGRAIDCVSEYRQWLRLSNGAIFIGLGTSVLFTLFLGVVYSSLCKVRLRKYYAIIMIGLGGSWLVFLVAGTLSPLVTMMQTLS
ncbi:PspC domain-containing protein [uncultured Gimesia sp.]|uniref:PspC domain-containing protein n=1 Tax=uncultured Gimesia sp. TaxID=1678688 RepID=UPI0030D7BCDE